MRPNRTIKQSISIDTTPNNNIKQRKEPISFSSSSKHQNSIKCKVQSYFPNSGFDSLYPEPRTLPDRGKKVQTTQRTKVDEFFCGFSDNEVIFRKNPQPDFKPISMLCNKFETTMQGKKTFLHPLPSNDIKQFGFLRTFHGIKPHNLKQYMQRRKEVPNINTAKKDLSIISWKDTSLDHSIDVQFKTRDFETQNTIPQPSIEYTLEDSFGGRRRKLFNHEDRRNKINIRALGDKPYKYPEHTIDFFKLEGLIPGSSMKNRVPKVINNKFIEILTTEADT